MQCTFDLFQIAQLVRNSEYDPRKSPALILKINIPKATAMIYKEGGMTITGVKTQEEGLKSAKKIGKVLKKLNYHVRVKKVVVKSIMATSNCNFNVDIESVSYGPQFKKFVYYNPSVFAGIRASVFVSGKMIFIGAKEIDELEKSVDFVFKIMMIHERKAIQMLDVFQNNQENEKQETNITKEQRNQNLKDKKKKDPFFGKKPRY